MRKQVRKRKCKNCKELFLPDHRNRKRQKYCSALPCRKASKADSQRRWLAREENQNTFKCEDNVDRVRAWRASHPGYWRKKKKALQEPLSSETTEGQGIKASLNEDALQDVLSAQTTVLLGLIAQLSGLALQDDIASYARRLRQLGDDVLNRQPQQQGGNHDLKTPLMPPADPQATGRVQLDRPSAGP